MKKKTSLRELKRIADKYNISLHTAEEIVRSQWEFMVNVLRNVDPEEKYYPVYKIKHIGKFIVTPGRQFYAENEVRIRNLRLNDNTGLKVFQESDNLLSESEEYSFDAV